MKKTLLTTSEILAVAIAVVIVVLAVCTLSNLVLSIGKSTVGQPKLAAGVDESSVCFNADDIDSLRSSLNVIYTNKHGAKTAVFGYKLSASVQGDICLLTISYNGLTTTVKINTTQR